MIKASEVSDQIIATSRLLEQAGNIIMAEFDLTLATFETLNLISSGVDTTTALAKRTKSTLANITHKTRMLEQKGYLCRNMGSDDKRVWKFSLTPEGKMMLASVERFYEGAIRRLFSEFTEAELRSSLDVLVRTRQHLELLMDRRSDLQQYARELKQGG